MSDGDLVIREAASDDIEAMAALIQALGYDVTADELRHRLPVLEAAGEHTLVADLGGILGVLTTSRTIVLHRPRPVGRISMMVVAEAQRGRGIGAALVAAAEERLRAQGCGMVEVTSNARRERAHRFYERLGYERTSHRFAKALV